jgi:Divergent InlB B-repeat domain
LTVTIAGQGTVKSTPAAIDCPSTCSAAFPGGAKVTLSASPASGFHFAGWTGAACAGTQDCTVTLASDAIVSATFAVNPPPPPPPPADECAGLMPASLPAPVPVDVDANGTCLQGVSDDGDGTFLLGVLTDQGLGPVQFHRFYEIQAGKAVQVGKEVFGNDEAGLNIFSQPSGFSVFATHGPTGQSNLDTWSHDGALVSTTPIMTFNNSHVPSSVAGVDPSGGTAVGRTYFTDDQGWITTYQRFNRSGAAETSEVLIDKGEHPVGAVAVALSGHALILVRLGASSWQGQWVARDGTRIGGAFTVQSPTENFAFAQFLLDGSVVVGFAGGPFVYRIEDGSPVAGSLPDWLQQRSSNTFQGIRSGKAYATWGSGGQCNGDIEVVATSGKSCGCVRVPDFRSRASIGRDSSLIVPGPLSGPGCTYQLYPKLFR